MKKNLVIILVGLQFAGLGQGRRDRSAGRPIVEDGHVRKQALTVFLVDIELISLELIDEDPLLNGDVRLFLKDTEMGLLEREVRGGEDLIVEKKHEQGHEYAESQYRSDQAEQMDAAAFDGCDFHIGTQPSERQQS